MEKDFGCLLLRIFHPGSLDQPQIPGPLHQIAQCLGERHLVFFTGNKVQLAEPPAHDSDHRNDKHHIPGQHRAVLQHLTQCHHRRVDCCDQIDDHVEVNITLGSVGSDPAYQGIAAFSVIISGRQMHQLVPQLVPDSQIDLLICPVA